ncbi:MAG: MmcQ/YjbR family DNA-binding protein [Verrucomicrobiota bacterium]
MRHPDFRIGGKVFASLGYPDNDWAMVKLVPEQQRAWIERDPLVFRPCNGVWGARGATNVHLASAKVSDVRAALKAATRIRSRPEEAELTAAPPVNADGTLLDISLTTVDANPRQNRIDYVEFPAPSVAALRASKEFYHQSLAGLAGLG